MPNPDQSATATEKCRHCHQPVPDGLRGSEFCCSGCRYVFELIRSEDLGRFYDFAQFEKLTPVGDRVLQPGDHQWAQLHQQHVEQKIDSAAEPSASAETTLEIINLSCAACVWLIESRFEAQPGAVRIRIDATDGTTRICWRVSDFDLARFIGDAARFGYDIRLPQATNDDSAKDRNQTRALGLRLGAAASFAMNAMAFTLPRYFGMDPDFLFASLFELVAATSATLAAVAALSWFGPRAWQALRSGVPHIDLPIVLGISAAWIGSIIGWALNHEALLYFDFVAIFSTLMLTGRWLQERAMAATRSKLRGPGLPRYLRLAERDEAQTIAVEDLTRSTAFLLPAGEVSPVDAILADESSASISREWITGEADPQTIPPGSVVAAGVRNAGSRDLTLRALEGFADSELAGLAATARPGRNDNNRFGGRLLRIYLWSVIALSIGGGLYWWLWRGDGLGGIQVAISILVVSCPCALGVAIPLADRLAARRAEKAGTIVRTPKLWDRLSKVKRLVFDKTGTLTVEFPQVLNASALDVLTGPQRDHLRQLVAHNRHPFALALRASLMRRSVQATATTASGPYREIPGKGVEIIEPDTGTWRLGSSRWLENGSSAPPADCVFSHNGQVLARFDFREQLRENAADEIAALQQQVGPVTILSGDRNQRVQELAARLGLPAGQALGEHQPEAKARWIDANAGDHTLFVGDGANDRHAFDRALVRGAPLSAFAPLEEHLDFVLLGDSLSPLRRLFDVAALHHQALRQILGLGIGYNLLAITLCLQQYMHPLLAAIAMPISSLAMLGFTWWRLGPAKTKRELVVHQAAAGRRFNTSRKIPGSASA